MACLSSWLLLDISTHTPHARCDVPINQPKLNALNFYSHTSCEVRPLVLIVQIPLLLFLLTHLMRGATNLQKSSLSF